MRLRLALQIRTLLSAYGVPFVVFGTAAVFGFWVSTSPAYLMEGRARENLKKCASERSNSAQTECAFSILTSVLDSHGIESAMKVFRDAYETLPAFVNEGCHKQAHRMGDLAYYRVYAGVGSVEEIDFPQETTACGYGFFHGFLEHLIQDHPTAEFATHVCEYLSRVYKHDMGDIRLTCYHGVGHGFMLGNSELIPENRLGDIRAFVDVPFAQCEALSQADTAEREQCKEGIFNLIADWRDMDQFGFARPQEGDKLFAICDELPKRMHNACYYEMAQKLDRFGQNDPQRIAEIVRFGKDSDFHGTAFSVGIGGVIQQVIGKGDAYKVVLESCVAMEGEFSHKCLKSMINGFFEHGEPQAEYKKPLEICGLGLVREKSLESVCYTTIAKRLRRFYTQERAQEICNEFPLSYRDKCAVFASAS